MNAQDATRTLTCKEHGCERDAKAERGINAYCDEHRKQRLDAARAARTDRVLNGLQANDAPAPRAAKRPKGRREVTPLEQAALQLAEIAARMDDARRRAEDALAEYRDLKAAWRSALANLTRVEQQREPMRTEATA